MKAARHCREGAHSKLFPSAASALCMRVSSALPATALTQAQSRLAVCARAQHFLSILTSVLQTHTSCLLDFCITSEIELEEEMR